jgi:hypothetical protein
MNTFAAKYLAGRPEIRGESGRSLGWGGRLESLKVPVRDFDYQHLAQWAEFQQVSCGSTEGRAPKCEGREGYYRVSESHVLDATGLKGRHLKDTADSVRHTVSARPVDRGTELRLTADGSNSEYQASPAGIHLAGTPPRNSGKSEGSPVEMPSVFHLPNWKVFVAGIGFWAVIYRLWK